MEPGEADPTQVAEVPDAPGEQTPEGQQQQVSGFQARINELTAARRQAEQLAAQSQSQVADLVAKVAELSARTAAPPEPVSDDPETRILAEMRKMRDEFTSRISELNGQVAVSQVARVAASMGVTDPALIARAEQFTAHFKAKGLPLIPADALQFSAGEHALNPANRRGTPKSAAGTSPVLQQVSAPLSQTQRSPRLPANVDQLSPQEQYAAYEKAGVDLEEF